MPTLRPKLQVIVRQLLENSEDRRTIEIDAIGDAIGVTAIDSTEIDAILSALEAAGRRVLAPDGARGVSALKAVISTAVSLRAALGRAPTVEEIAARAGLAETDVRHALLLAKVMGRG